MKLCHFCLGLVLALGLAGQSLPVETYPMVGDLGMPRVMHQGGDGTIWVGATSGLYRVAGGKLIPAGGGRTTSTMLALEEYESNLWIGTLNGFFRWTEGRLERVHPGVTPSFARLGKHLYFSLFEKPGLRRIDLEACAKRKRCESSQIEATATWMVAVGADGKLWFPCGKQICVLREDRNPVEIERRGIQQGVPALNWQKCLIDRSGTLWAITSTGVYRQLPGEPELSLFQGMIREGSNSDTLELDTEGDVIASSIDLIWLGRRAKFYSTTALGLGNTFISAQLADRSGGIWFALASGQLVRLKSKGKVEVWSGKEEFEPIASNHLLLEDGSEWSSSRSKISYLRPGDKEWSSISIDGQKGFVRLFRSGKSRLVAELPDGRLFEIDGNSLKVQARSVEEVHTEGPSLVLPTGRDLVWIRKTGQNEERILLKLLKGSRIYRNFVEDREGRLWFVTYQGLAVINRDGTSRLFTTQDGLRMNSIQVAELGADNDLWIGYDTPSDATVVKVPGGVIGEKTVLEIRHIAPSREQESVYSFGFDLQNRVWKGTELGMLLGDAKRPEATEWMTMGEGDGLPHPDVVLKSFLRYPDGSVGFNTLKGRVRVYEPEKLFQPGQLVSLNGVLEEGLARLAMMPADAKYHVELEYRERSWFGGWKTAPGLEFAVGREVEGIEVRVVDNYYFRGSGSLRLGQKRLSTGVWWLLGVLVVLMSWWFGILGNLWFRWRKRQFATPIEVQNPVVEELLPGTMLKGRFRIQKVMARGNFSDVYEAIDSAQDNTRVVVKRLKLPDFEGDFSESWLKRRFMQEVGAATMLRHPGVLPIVEAWIESRMPGVATPYLVMRRVEGPTLRGYLNEHGRLEPDLALGWLRQLGEVMEEAHSRGIIHCDLKPENVMLEHNGKSFKILVIDFGTSALCLESEVMSKQTRPLGTATYMAPEQLMGSYSAASDLYAFALIAMEMLTGKKYRDFEIRFDDNWESDLKTALTELGLPITMAEVFVCGLRFTPQQREQNLSTWLRQLEASWQT